jgi:NADPH:quinone reductase-like Zn-dependent oxidoreductase
VSEQTEQMQAVVCSAYGGPEVLSLRQVDKPVPAPHQVRIKVFATTVTAACTMMRKADTWVARLLLGLRKPRKRYRVMGIELAGEVDAVGSRVTSFRPGERVFGFAGFTPGAYAQYCCLPERGSLAVMPERLSYEQAVSIVDGPTTALYFLRDRARVRAGERVLVIGASGSIGTAAVQLARHFGAEVTGVCSTSNVGLVSSLGAHHVIDYTQEDFTEQSSVYDVVFDTVGKSSFARCRRVLSRGGRYLTTVGGPGLYARDAWSRLFGDKKFIFGMSVEKRSSLREVARLSELGELRPVIDRRYDLDEIVEAHRYVDQGRKKGNVVISVAHR